MTVIVLCGLLALLMPYLVKVVVGIEMHKLGGYDNKYPREQQSNLEGLGARMLAAHQNCFESLGVFSMAIAVVLGTQNINETTEMLALTHVIARILYCFFYYIDSDKLRTLSWMVGIGTAIAMVVSSI